MPVRLAVAVAAALLAAVPPPAGACGRRCKCAPPPAPREALAGADAVFRGEVVAVRDTVADVHGVGRAAPGRVATLRVTARWKGAAADTVQVLTGAGGGDCGVPFLPVGAYLVYASADGTALRTTSCTRTRPAIEAEADLAAIGPPLP